MSFMERLFDRLGDAIDQHDVNKARRKWIEHELEWADFVDTDTDQLWVKFYGSTHPRTCPEMHQFRDMGRCIVPDNDLHHGPGTVHVCKPDHHRPHQWPNWWWTR